MLFQFFPYYKQKLCNSKMVSSCFKRYNVSQLYLGLFTRTTMKAR